MLLIEFSPINLSSELLLLLYFWRAETTVCPVNTEHETTIYIDRDIDKANVLLIPRAKEPISHHNSAGQAMQ